MPRTVMILKLEFTCSRCYSIDVFEGRDPSTTLALNQAHDKARAAGWIPGGGEIDLCPSCHKDYKDFILKSKIEEPGQAPLTAAPSEGVEPGVGAAPSPGSPSPPESNVMSPHINRIFGRELR